MKVIIVLGRAKHESSKPLVKSLIHFSCYVSGGHFVCLFQGGGGGHDSNDLEMSK